MSEETRTARILIVDDETNMRRSLGAVLRRQGYDVVEAAHGRQALELLEDGRFDLILSDIKMPLLDGMGLLEAVQRDHEGIPVIMMTAFGTIESAVEAMRKGARDYVTKPFSMEEIRLKIERCLEESRTRWRKEYLESENRLLWEEIEGRFPVDGLIGAAPQIEEIAELIRKVADQRSTVLITGESGVGKEVVARAIHFGGRRARGPFVKVNCAALPQTLLESELFGHEKGAFTGAAKRRLGRFELAQNGTIFLDEIGEIPPAVQVKLLRVLQEQEFERLGGEETISVNTRVIAATNRDLEKAMREKAFREDLYYRLNVIRIHVPPLRERACDIPLLVRHFIRKFAEETGKQVHDIAPDALEAMVRYPWPGNVRELENAVERAVVLESEPVITTRYLPPEVREHVAQGEEGAAEARISRMALAERDAIVRALREAGGRRDIAARKLGIGRTTLWRKMKQYGLQG
jgi:DNA-binding NtrC family response regulator